MGTWDTGLLDNDAACDGLGDLQHQIVQDIVAIGAGRPTSASTEQLCGAVGVLLQLAAHPFDVEVESGRQIEEALRSHATTIADLTPAARKLMTLVMDGRGKELGERRAKADSHDMLLHSGAKESCFGQREESLFASKPAEQYVQSLAEKCVATIDEDFEDESIWSDLCREATGMGHLAVLTVLEPCKVSTSKIAEWRRLAQRGIDELRARKDSELDFHEEYYANLDKVYALLIERFA
jgi:hypothetical protein